MTHLPNIRLLTEQELAEQLSSQQIPKYRAQQIYSWLWGSYTLSFEQMTNIPISLRNSLAQWYSIPTTRVKHTQYSTDGTIKIGFETYDGHMIEGVIIPTEDRITACISSQVGCSLACTFCATGMLKRARNLMAFEIYDQAYLLNQIALERLHHKLTNVVYMGMGEPLLNYHEVVRSLYLLNDTTYGLGLAARRITVSTSGLARQILKLADEKIKINLALSLHAPDNVKRDQIMDINRSNPIEKVLDALKVYYQRTKNKISYEYLLLGGFNDQLADADALAALCRDFPVYVNLIEYNPVSGSPHFRSQKDTRDAFLERLRSHGVESKVRKSRGRDIDAACGQLANKISTQAVKIED